MPSTTSDFSHSDAQACTVACLGSSTTASKGTFNWIEELGKRPQNRRFRFVNHGVGGDLIYNALQRLPEVVADRPDAVVVLIGANDILAQVFPRLHRLYRRWKHLSENPSPAWSRQLLQSIVRRLKEQTSGRIALASLAEVGEAPASTHPVQAELNRLFAEYREMIETIAHEESVAYLPFYERMHEQILASPGRAFTRFRFASFYRDYIFREFILGMGVDQIARLNGWRFHIDGVHLNSSGGLILAGVVQEFLDLALRS
ncbi:MAG TPA: GDSL-type esterase/lipase family protein [Chthoniobacter sp.]|jgi:lysophospholipase L1-like esterase